MTNEVTVASRIEVSVLPVAEPERPEHDDRWVLWNLLHEMGFGTGPDGAAVDRILETGFARRGPIMAAKRNPPERIWAWVDPDQGTRWLPFDPGTSLVSEYVRSTGDQPHAAEPATPCPDTVDQAAKRAARWLAANTPLAPEEIVACEHAIRDLAG
jgi:hypothetical protein